MKKHCQKLAESHARENDYDEHKEKAPQPKNRVW